MRAKRTAEQKLRRLRKALRQIAAYPPDGHPRRADDGYPTEFTYDEFTYRRMVDTFRNGIQAALAEK